jgi:hypothetical protein
VFIVSELEKQSLHYERGVGLVLKFTTKAVTCHHVTARTGKMKQMITLFNGQLRRFDILYVWFEEKSDIILRAIMILRVGV